MLSRLLGISDLANEEDNIEQCRKSISDNNLPASIPPTYVERYGDSIVIIQEYINGQTDYVLSQNITGKLEPLPIEETFIDIGTDNFLFSNGNPYLIDVSAGFYYKFANKYGKKTSKLLWHLLQMIKLSFIRTEFLLFRKDKRYTSSKLAVFLKNLYVQKKSYIRIRIMCWHLAHICKLCLNIQNRQSHSGNTFKKTP
jgi:hypothetical protein